MIRFTTKLWNGYLKVLDKAPWKVQIIQTGKSPFCKTFFQDFFFKKFQYLGTLMASGDIIAQCWLEKVPVQKIDWSRTARFGIIGCIFVVSYSLQTVWKSGGFFCYSDFTWNLTVILKDLKALNFDVEKCFHFSYDWNVPKFKFLASGSVKMTVFRL